MATDFCVWLRADPDDPGDHVSLFIFSERAAKWCTENHVPRDDMHAWSNEAAWLFCEHVREAGFDVDVMS